MPYSSRKCLIYEFIYPLYTIGKNGKLLFLLKDKSRPIQASKKRRKVELLGTFADYKLQESIAVAEQNIIDDKSDGE